LLGVKIDRFNTCIQIFAATKARQSPDKDRTEYLKY
jgi:hypothetical protein